MFFCGDIAISGKLNNLDMDITLPPSLAGSTSEVIANLEGALIDSVCVEQTLCQRKVFNHNNVIMWLKRNGITTVSLANNHIFDLDDDIENTLSPLRDNKIGICGVGSDLAEAAKAYEFCENCVPYALLAFGWDTMGCIYAKRNAPGVNPMNVPHIVNSIKKYKGKGKQVVCFFHWCYEYELYPLPMHRELAKLAIDTGASLVVGTHPHCVQGIEFYKSKPIVYSLGNFMFDSGVYFGSRIRTKEWGVEELCIEWKTETLVCHWYQYNQDKGVPQFIQSESAAESKRIKELTPFTGLSDSEYIEWFKKNRRIHKALPIFARLNNRYQNRIFHYYIRYREKISRSIRRGLGNG